MCMDVVKLQCVCPCDALPPEEIRALEPHMSFLLHFIWQWGKLCFALFKFEEKLSWLCSCDRKCCNQTECMNYLQFYKLVKIRQKLMDSQEFKKKKASGFKTKSWGDILTRTGEQTFHSHTLGCFNICRWEQCSALSQHIRDASVWLCGCNASDVDTPKKYSWKVNIFSRCAWLRACQDHTFAHA